MMDARSPVFNGPPLKASEVMPLRETSPVYLTPPSPIPIDNITLGMTLESKLDSSVDPDILVHYPLSVMSPMVSEDESSSPWDWDNEIDTLK